MLWSSTVACTVATICSGFVLGGCDSGIVHLGDGRGASDGGGSGDSGAVPCTRGQVKAAEVIWMGDTWVTVPGTQVRRVRDHARTAGAIGPTDEYVVVAEAGKDMAAIAKQYQIQQAGPTDVKVAIMAGGTWDTIWQGEGDAVIANVVATFGTLLDQMAADGTVQHVIYFLCPELPGIPGVATLRPLLRQACEDDSPVPCRFLDLQPLWRPEYTAATGYQATDAGAVVIGDAIWKVMQDNCIAQ